MSRISYVVPLGRLHAVSRVTRLRIILTGAMLTTYLLVLAIQACAQTSSGHSLMQGERTAYFSFNDTTLTTETRQRLDALATGIKTHNGIRGARVVGFADRIGDPSYNEELSKKRAESVKDYLVSKGIVHASVADTRWFGDSLPATNCPDKLPKSELINCLQQDRRVEVEVDYATQIAAAQ
jgi:outer membrane protein OmpA-like peptidoglycan-associated protein